MAGCPSAPRDPRALIPAAELQGVSPYETQLLQAHREKARACLERFAWCSEVRDERFAEGIGGWLGVFAMEVLVKGRSREWLWVVAGELPAAYFALARAPCPCRAMRVYCELLERWVAAVVTGALDRDVFAFELEATPEAARAVAARLAAIRRVVEGTFCAAGRAPAPEP